MISSFFWGGDQGQCSAQYDLGDCYLLGQELKKNSLVDSFVHNTLTILIVDVNHLPGMEVGKNKKAFRLIAFWSTYKEQ